MPLKSGLEVGYAWLTREKAEMPDMSGPGVGYIRPESLESGYGADLSGPTRVFSGSIDI
jgi:hypothetical protein